MTLPVPILPSLRPDPSNSPAFSKLRLEYNLSPKGQLSPRHPALPNPGANFKTWRESSQPGSENSEDSDEAEKNGGVEAEQEEAERDQEQSKEEDQIIALMSQMDSDDSDESEAVDIILE